MTVHIYSDFVAGDDAWDGSQATSGGGSIGPKKGNYILDSLGVLC